MPAAAFVLIWSSGYISGPAAVHAAAPFTVLGWRFVLWPSSPPAWPSR